MSEEPPAKRIRKGTKSCQECRHRKTRCIWPSDNAQVCQGCHTRNRICELQIEVVQTSETAKLTSRARIDALEKQVSDLWHAINQSPPVSLDQQHHAAQSRQMTVDGTSAQAKLHQMVFWARLCLSHYRVLLPETESPTRYEVQTDLFGQWLDTE
jgi:hypothetical protein